ncbi:LPXTG cell wall anchor domain-containing protein [Weissella minor]|uniref:LPXTG cell wall anchor domain-containing protein n=1 Tax=Weissella minor TaxID=1620 RepID=UPI003AF2DF12
MIRTNLVLFPLTFLISFFYLNTLNCGFIEANSIRNPDKPELVVQPDIVNTVTTKAAIGYSKSQNPLNNNGKDIVQKDNSQNVSEIDGNDSLQNQHYLPATGYNETLVLTTIGFVLILGSIGAVSPIKK